MLWLLFLAWSIGANAALRAAKDKPNIIMFFVDDLGYGDVGFNGHPTTVTPNIDKLAWGGKILSTWYSGCPVCSGSRGALMTGRHYVRIGLPGVFGPTGNTGLPLNETTVAEQLKKAGYATAAMGKWHLGNRRVYLPGNRGFDHYLGIPYSDDMGRARLSSCNSNKEILISKGSQSDWEQYVQSNFTLPGDHSIVTNDPAGSFLPLVSQEPMTNGSVNTTVLEQPLDLTTLPLKYNAYVLKFIKDNKDKPFFLYMPFSHVHTTSGNIPQEQYARCKAQNTTRRGKFGDALHDVDWIIGNVADAVSQAGLEKNTLIIFTGDNGPWMEKAVSSGSEGLFIGRTSGYWNTGKGSSWEGGIREAGFAYWPGQITPFTRTAEVVSSLDLFPTLSAIAGVSMPTDRVYDGRDASEILFNDQGKSKHEFLWIYNGNAAGTHGPSAVRFGTFKAHWVTGPGLGGCKFGNGTQCPTVKYLDRPLLFNIDEDPSEAYPLHGSEYDNVIKTIQTAYNKEKSTFWWGKLYAEPDEPGEGPDKYGVCCDRAKGCDCNGKPHL